MADGGLPQPGGGQRTQTKFIIFENFEKLNTQSARQGLSEKQFAWLENIQPISENNYLTVPAAASAALATLSEITNLIFYAAINSVDYFIVFSTAGGGFAVNIATGNVAQFAADGTFSLAPDVTTWQASRILIADVKSGYCTWDGTVFVQQGGVSPNITITNPGSYATPPAITITGGSGTGATAVGTLTGSSLTGIQLTNPGTGYQPTDTLTVNIAAATGSGAAGHVTMTGVTINSIQITQNGTWASGTPAGNYNMTFAGGTLISGTPSGVVNLAHIAGNPSNELTIDGLGYTGNARWMSAPSIGVNAPNVINNPILTPIFNADGTVASIVRTAGGSGYVTPPPVKISGGSGIPATAHATVSGGAVNALVLDTVGAGYALGQTPVVVIGQVSSATAIAHVWPFIPFPATIAVFQGRVWLGGGTGTDAQLLQWSGTGAAYGNVGYDDFLIADASGSLLITDADLVHAITALRSLNNYLFIMGDQSVKQIGSISLDSTGEVTLFTILTLSSDQGTDWPKSCISYNRVFLFANTNGIYGVFGSSVQKLSGDLDGIFKAVNFTQTIQGAVIDLNAIHNAVYLVRYIDPVAGTRSLLLLFDGKKWWTASQSSTLVAIATFQQQTPDLNELYGSSGMDITQLFANPAGAVTFKIQTALTHHGNALQGKRVIRAGLTSNLVGATGQVNYELDADAMTQARVLGVGSGFGLVGGSNDANNNPMSVAGIYLGVTITGTLSNWTFTNGILEYQETSLWKGA